MALNVVGSFEAVDRLFVVLQVREAESLVMPYFPVLVSRGGEEVTSEELEIVVKECLVECLVECLAESRSLLPQPG